MHAQSCKSYDRTLMYVCENCGGKESVQAEVDSLKEINRELVGVMREATMYMDVTFPVDTVLDKMRDIIDKAEGK